jgi:hypothetical protein
LQINCRHEPTRPDTGGDDRSHAEHSGRARRRRSLLSGAPPPCRGGHAYAKLSAPYRLSSRFPDYPDARAFHDALLRANPERLLWGTDWPHPSIDADVMPDDGQLVDLFHQWTPDKRARQLILVETPGRLFD